MNWLNKVKTMTYSEIVAIKQPVYKCLKIMPHSSTRNYNSVTLAKMVSSMYTKIEQRIKWEERKLIYHTQMKCTYIVDIFKNDVSFYFLVPQQYVKLAKDKIIQTWNKVKVEECEVPSISGGETYYIKYKNRDELSLDVDKKCNDPLNNILGVIDIMEADDRVTIACNLMPCNNYGWHTKCDKTIEAYKNGNSVKKEIGGASLILNILYAVANFLDDVLNDLFPKSAQNNTFADFCRAFSEERHEVSASTKAKRKDKPIDTQIAIISSSNDKLRATNNAIAVSQAFEVLEGDNQLESCRLYRNGGIDLTKSRFKGIPTNRFCLAECQTLLQLPGRELLEEYHISHNNVIETTVPSELQKGVMCIGENVCKENKTKAYLSTDKSYQYLTWVLIGPTRAGKTTLINNVVLDSALTRESNIVLDWCGNCELSEDVKNALKGKVDILEIKGDDWEHLQGLGYNELNCTSDNTFERYDSAKKQSMQLMTLINCLQSGDEDLRARMERYLSAAALIVFVNNGPIKDVFEVLRDHRMRGKYIEKIPKNQEENLEKYVNYLKELDEYNKSKDAIIGTKLTAVQGILNRVARLEQNTYMEKMLQVDCSKNVDLVEEIQKGKLILIKMPEGMFSTEAEKDVMRLTGSRKYGAHSKREK